MQRNVEKYYDQNAREGWDRLGEHQTECKVIPLGESAGFITLRFKGGEGLLADHKNYVNSLPGQAHDPWMEFICRLSREPCLLCAPNHLLHVGWKEI